MLNTTKTTRKNRYITQKKLSKRRTVKKQKLIPTVLLLPHLRKNYSPKNLNLTIIIHALTIAIVHTAIIHSQAIQETIINKKQMIKRDPFSYTKKNNQDDHSLLIRATIERPDGQKTIIETYKNGIIKKIPSTLRLKG